MEATPENRRKEIREKTNLSVKVKTADLFLVGIMQDISGSGMQIDSEISINPRTDVEVVLEFGDNLEPKEKVTFLGRIVWSLGDYEGGRYIYKMGMQTSTITYREKIADTFVGRANLVELLLPKLSRSEFSVDNTKYRRTI